MAITTDCAEGRHAVCRGAGPNHHCPQTAHLGDQKCACRCHTCVPDGERVTTGSEPTKYVICKHCWQVIGIDGEQNPDIQVTVCSHLRGVEVVEQDDGDSDEH